MTDETHTLADATATTVTIRHDDWANEPGLDDPDANVTVLEATRGESVHEQLRGESVAVRADTPLSIHRDGGTGRTIIMSPERVRADYGSDTAETREQAQKYVDAIAAAWRAWADGEVYAYSVTRSHACECCEQSVTLDDLGDSCGGFIIVQPHPMTPDVFAGYFPDDRYALAAFEQAVDQGFGADGFFATVQHADVDALDE